MKRTKTADTTFVPLHGLATLGAGGLTVSLFMWLLFLTPHAGVPVPTFETLQAYAASEDLAWFFVRSIQAGILVIAAVHLALVVWMLKGLAAFKRSPQFTAFWQSHMGLPERCKLRRTFEGSKSFEHPHNQCKMDRCND